MDLRFFLDFFGVSRSTPWKTVCDLRFSKLFLSLEIDCFVASKRRLNPELDHDIVGWLIRFYDMGLYS